MSSSFEVYHERQSKELCALHALNNVFQSSDAFTQTDLDNICYTLSPDSSTWLNPHRSWLGLGNYDVNVLTAALHTKDCDVVWFDKRKDPHIINTSNVMGYILNVPNDFRLGWVMLPLKRKHWIALKELKQEGGFFNLDSKLKSPELIGDREDFFAFLLAELSDREKELFLVVRQGVSELDSWRV